MLPCAMLSVLSQTWCNVVTDAVQCCHRRGAMLSQTWCNVVTDAVQCCHRHGCNVVTDALQCCHRRGAMLSQTRCNVVTDAVAMLSQTRCNVVTDAVAMLSQTRCDDVLNSKSIFVSSAEDQTVVNFQASAEVSSASSLDRPAALLTLRRARSRAFEGRIKYSTPV